MWTHARRRLEPRPARPRASSCRSRRDRRRRPAVRRRAWRRRGRGPASSSEHGPARHQKASPWPRYVGTRSDEGARRRAGGRCWRARRARRTSRAGTRRGRRSAAAPAACPVSGVCTSPAPSSPVRCRPGGAHGIGSRSAPAAPEATSPPPCTVAICGGGAADDREPEEGRRPGLEGLVVVEQRRAPAGPEPAATSVTTGSVRRWPRPSRSRRRSRTRARPTSASALGDLAAAHLELGARRRLEPADDQRPGPLARDRRRARRRPGPRRSSRRPGGSPPRATTVRARSQRPPSASYSGERFGPTCWPPIRSPASTSMATRTGTAREARTESTRSRWATSSTIRVIAGRGRRRGDQLGERAAVDGRVGHHDVVADAAARAATAPRAGCRPGRPRKPSWSSARRSRAGTRTDLDATRSGLPAARRTRSSALASKASRSTTRAGWTGGSPRAATAVVQPGPQAVAVDEVVRHQEMPRLRSSASISAMSSSIAGAPRVDVRGQRARLLAGAGRPGATRRGRGSAGSADDDRSATTDTPASTTPVHTNGLKTRFVAQSATASTMSAEHLQGPGQAGRGGQQGEAQRRAGRRPGLGAGRTARSRSHRAR